MANISIPSITDEQERALCAVIGLAQHCFQFPEHKKYSKHFDAALGGVRTCAYELCGNDESLLSSKNYANLARAGIDALQQSNNKYTNMQFLRALDKVLQLAAIAATLTFSNKPVEHRFFSHDYNKLSGLTVYVSSALLSLELEGQGSGQRDYHATSQSKRATTSGIYTAGGAV